MIKKETPPGVVPEGVSRVSGQGNSYPLSLRERQTGNLTYNFDELNARNAASCVVTCSHTVDGLYTNGAQVSFVSAVCEVVVVEDLLAVDLTFREVHRILTHSKSVTDRGSDRVGLDEQCTSREGVARFDVSGQSSVTSNASERDGSEVVGNVTVVVLVESNRSVGIDTEDVVGSVVVSSESSSATTWEAYFNTAEVGSVVTVGSTQCVGGEVNCVERVKRWKQRRALASASCVDENVVVGDDVVVPFCVRSGVQLVAVGTAVSLKDCFEVVRVGTERTQAGVRSEEQVTRDVLIDVSASVDWLTAVGDKSLLSLLDDVGGKTVNILEGSAGTCSVSVDEVRTGRVLQADLTKCVLDVILLGAAHPFGHDFS